MDGSGSAEGSQAVAKSLQGTKRWQNLATGAVRGSIGSQIQEELDGTSLEVQ